MRHIAGIVLFAVAYTASGSSQQQHATKSQPPRGAVTGTIYCGDSNAPARLAQLSLLPANRQQGDQVFMAQSDLDGRFAIGRLPEGTYYVSVKYAGYLDTFPLAKSSDLAGLNADERKQFEAQALTVSISAQQASTIAVHLDRAAVLEGTVLYDDGSPAIGLHMNIRPKPRPGAVTTKSKAADDLFGLTIVLNDAFARVTDDHGHFRAVGLAPGEYLVSTTLSTASGTAPPDSPEIELVKSTPSGGLVMYYGDTARASEAKTIKIAGGESNAEADITIPLSKLHSVHGRVILKRTGQPPPTAALRLLYADTREFARMAVAVNGEFELNYIPEGSYILQAQASADPAPANEEDGNGTISGSFGVFIETGDFDFAPHVSIDESASSEIPIDVHGELTGIALEVPDAPAKKSGATASSVSIPTVTVGPPQQ
ncbi:hypothetical protein [Terracidiphilus sp.]|jgi:hypothetical protein|uniref:carboxypeptidase-like regulatory domain-containing protein n=1 Tax=Terracidiphilus sp. TaxID=1964191 RepID=UPI003C182F94